MCDTVIPTLGDTHPSYCSAAGRCGGLIASSLPAHRKQRKVQDQGCRAAAVNSLMRSGIVKTNAACWPCGGLSRHSLKKFSRQFTLSSGSCSSLSSSETDSLVGR